MPTGDDCRVVVAEGDVDLAALDDFRALLHDAEDDRAACVVLDLSAVEFVDSMGLGVLLEADGRFGRRGRTLAIVAPPGTAPALALGLAGLKQRLRVFDSRAEALAAQQRRPG